MLELRRLRLLRELRERGTIAAVADALAYTPSAVSQQLKALQRQVGVPLVERAGRGVQLTDAGRALVVGAVTVATALGIHPQTVRYRLGLLRELLGADLDDPQRRFELALVLHGRTPPR